MWLSKQSDIKKQTNIKNGTSTVLKPTLCPHVSIKCIFATLVDHLV